MATIQEKVKALADKFFSGDEAKAGAIIAAVSATDKEIAESGVAFKQDAETTPAETTAKADETPASEAAPVAEAEAAPEREAKVDDTPEDESAGFIGDMTPDEFVSMLAPAIAEALAAAMAPTMSELSATKGALETAQKELAALQTTKAKEASETAGALAGIDARVKELEGDSPTGARGYRASADGATATAKAKELSPAPAIVTETERLSAWAVN